MAIRRFKPDVDELLGLYAEGLSAEAIAKRYGVSKPTILRNLKELNAEMRTRRKVTPEVEALILVMAQEGYTIAQAEKALGLEATVIRECAARYGLRFRNPYHVGFITTWNGYRALHKPEHPGADAKGYVREHILVAEAVLGRFLTAHEVVHHKDGDKTNNKPENLEVMSRREHAGHHARAGDTGWAKYHDNLKI